MNKSSLRVLILCTGNAIRSQMGEAIMRQLRPDWEVYSAGTHPAGWVHPLAVQVMSEVGLDISTFRSKGVQQYLAEPFDAVITVCDHAKEACPAFTGQVTHRVHMPFPDPFLAAGSDDKMLAVFRQVRDGIQRRFGEFVAEAGA